ERQSIRTFPYGYLFIGECSDALLTKISYRLCGNGQKTRHALVAKTHIESIRGWLEDRLGPLVHRAPVASGPPPGNWARRDFVQSKAFTSA
ncbi:MAG: hypothetical protein QOG25_1399, partial [Acetobacteraceae bacterium]|nr:hypothetical protein [Acetobacteraceae bacterium]